MSEPAKKKDVARIVGRDLSEAARTLANSEGWADHARMDPALARKYEAASTVIGSGDYGVIYADPPWRFKPIFSGAVYENDQEAHYPTMSLDDICALPVPAAKSAVLYLWVTSPHLDQGLRVIREWGFVYKSSAVWIKPWPRTGYWWRNQHELLLVANRGKWPAPKPKARAASLYEYPTTKHSEKPLEIRDQIASWWPNARRLEMFARTVAPGWDAWGNDVALGGAA